MATMTKRLYALAGSLGLVERNNKDDPFHQLVHGITGKEHVSDLTAAEGAAVQRELQERMKLKNNVNFRKKSELKEVHPGIMPIQQQRLAWRLIYRLCELDPTDAEPVDRLIGAIRKINGITASRSDPFRWISSAEGTKLIEQLKRYVRSAERKAGGTDGHK